MLATIFADLGLVNVSAVATRTSPRGARWQEEHVAATEQLIGAILCR